MAFRQVSGLTRVEALAGRPAVIPIGRPRGAKAAGCRYEASVAGLVARSFSDVRHGQWFEYEDRRGLGYCQPDILVVQPRRVIVFESKLTWVPEGQRQIDQLYRPVVENWFRRPVLGVVVCRMLTPEVQGKVAGGMAKAIEIAAGGRQVVWHHIGAWMPRRAKRKERAYG